MRIVVNRPIIGILMLLGSCGASPILADPPAAPAATAPAPAPDPSLTTSPPVAASAAAPSTASTAEKPVITVNAPITPDEKALLAAGYKPEMQNGTKVWCRREQELGSRLSGRKICGTSEQLRQSVHDSQDYAQQVQKKQNNGTGR